ncbi:hypothetical protein PUN28_009525 [Cardiocondyla obscurior]
MSQVQSSGLKRKRKKSKHKYKDDDENQTKIQQNEDNLIESDDKDTCYIKCKSKNIKNREKTSQDKDNELTEGLQDKDITSKTIKCKKKRIKINIIEYDENLTEEESKIKDNSKVKRKKIKNKIKISENNDLVIEKTKKSKDKYNDSEEEPPNSDTNRIVSEYSDTDNNLVTEEENDKKVGNKRKKLQDNDNDSNNDNDQVVSEYMNMGNDSSTELEDENTRKTKYTDEDYINKAESSQEKDSNSSQESKDIEICEIKSEDEDIRKQLIDNRKIKKLKSQNENDENILWKDESSDSSGVEEEYYSDATYLARKITSSQKLSQQELAHLYNMRIQLENDVLPQHMIETRAGSTIPTRHELEEFREIAPIKRGLFSLEEDKIIATNWKNFCKLHNWNVKKVHPFLQMRIDHSTTYMRKAERRKFAQFLANGLPNRTLYSVYHRYRNLYENNLNRRYKPEEDQMIIDHLEHNPCLDETRKYVDLAKVLRRTRHSIWRRYRLLKKKEN